MPAPPRLLLTTVAVAVSFTGASADWRTDVGHDRLAAELGTALPDGTGVPATIVEATQSDNYLPQGGTSPFVGTGKFAGITFTDKTITPADQSGNRSGHAAEVGGFFFSNTDSISPGINQVDCYNANDWIDNAALRTGSTAAPRTELSKVQNHSWIGSTGDDETDDELLQRLDFLIERDDVVVCVGLNNGAGKSVPVLLASAFNTISVGKTNGAHSTGTTPAEVSTPGRTRPDIVAPAGFTSHSTPMVSSAAALLVSSPGGGSRASVVYKSILLAGATKYQIPGWTSTPSQPLDPHFGVGQLDIYNSYHILDAGEQNSSSSSNRTSIGWDRTSSLTPGTPNEYFFEIPGGQTASEFSAALTWNRTITDTGFGLLFTPSESLHDLALTLEKTDGDFTPVSTVASSDSPIDNVEHIYTKNLEPGQYRLTVTGDSSKEYAVAWRTTLAPELTLTNTSITIDESAATATLTIQLDQPTLLPVTVDLTTAQGTATNTDFTPLFTTPFTIPVGTTTLDIPIAITPDDTHELDESFTVTLSAAHNATLTGPAVATVTITDDDPQPTLTLTAPTPTSEAAPTVNFTITLSNPTYLDVTANFTTIDATAGSATDYTTTTGLLTIPAETLTTTVTVPLLDDTEPEPDQSFSLDLSDVQNATPASTTASATLLDDDFPIVLQSLTSTPNTTTTDLTWPAVPGRTYRIETSTDLLTWTSATTLTATESPTTEPIPLTDPTLFFRIIDITNP